MLTKAALIYINNELNVGRGVGYIAGCLREGNVELQFFDTLHISDSNIISQLKQNPPELIMISSMTILFPQALQLAHKFKQALPKTPILVGGIHAMIAKGKLLEHPEIDFVCIGEGESFTRKLIKEWETVSFYDIPCLAYRKGSEIICNELAPAEDLSTLPDFPWDLFVDDAVVQPYNGFLYFNATRGCPFKCTYCCNAIYLSMYGKDYLRMRPVQSVLDEIEMLYKKYNPKLLYFGDEMILFNKKYAKELFEGFKQRFGRPFGCMARVEYLSSDNIDLMVRTGCIYVGVGIECGDEDFRKKYLHRNMTNKQIEITFERLHRANIFVTAFNMIGYPYDFDALLTKATEELLEKIKPDWTQVSIFFPFPGTEMYDYCEQTGKIDFDKLAKMSSYFEDSVFKGVSLSEQAAKMVSKFNPPDFTPYHSTRETIAGLQAEVRELRKLMEQRNPSTFFGKLNSLGIEVIDGLRVRLVRLAQKYWKRN